MPRIGTAVEILGMLVLLLSAQACGSGGGNTGGGGSTQCTSPKGTVRLSITPAACSAISDACADIEVVAKSPQISSLIAQGKSPCTSSHADPDGCSLNARAWSLTFCLDASQCGTHDFDLAQVFAPAVADPSLAITDTVTYCPIDSAGNALGACAGTIVDQCNASAVTRVYVNAFTPPPATAAVTFTSLTCVTNSTDAYGWKYCDVHSAGTAKGLEGDWFYATSNPVFADNVLLDCGSWTLGTNGCYRAAGQPETTNWSRIFDDLWINPDTYPNGRNVTVTGQVQEGEYGTIEATKSMTVTCGQ